MNLVIDTQTIQLVTGTGILLVIATLVGRIMPRFATSEGAVATVANFQARTRSWWIMVAVFALAMATGGIGSIILFGLTSFFALREFITQTPTKAADHRSLFWAFFVITPLQYYLIYTQWYGLFALLIPIYAFLFIPVRMAIAGDCENFMERLAKIQWGIMLCVFCISHIPAILMLDLAGYEGENAKLLFWLVLVVQISDVLQYVFGKTLGRHPIAPKVSPNKTWEGFWGGTLAATGIGAALWWVTPFSPLQAAGMAFLVNLLGFGGGLTMSAIKRDRGIKDFGNMIGGHGGMLDRLDSLCFAAPIFFHVTRYYFSN